MAHSKCNSVMSDTLKRTKWTDPKFKDFPNIDDSFKKKLNSERELKWRQFYEKVIKVKISCFKCV